MRTQKVRGMAVWRGAVLVLALALLAACGLKPGEVARIGREGVTLEQWQSYLRLHPAADDPQRAERKRDLVRREVAWLQADSKGLLSGPAWKETQDRIYGDALVQSYLAMQKGPDRFTEQEAKSFFTAHNSRRRVSHILCSSEAEARAAMARLERGEAFDKVARAISKDPGAAHGGGDLGWISREQVVKPFGDAAFSAQEGRLTGPVQTEFGWHIMLVTGIQTPAEGEFERNRAAIMTKMEDMRSQQRRQAALAPLKTKYPLDADQAVLDRDRTTVVASGDETLVAGRVAGQSITLKQLKEFLAVYIKTSGQSHSLGATTKTQFMELLADDYRLRAAALEAGLDKKPSVQADSWNLLHEAGLSVFARDFLARYVPGDHEMKAFYESHHALFAAPGTVHLQVLVIDQEDQAGLAAAEAKGGANWASLYARYANRESTGNWDAGWVQLADLARSLPPNASKALAGCEVGAVLGPFAGQEGWEVFKIVERNPGPVESLDACRSRVQEELIKADGASIVAAHLDGPARAGMRVEWRQDA